eukprot:TRINITY_DN4458_c0_g1_i1.p1 TRINITY_DN4458_c0_g1~~TRINITY_DN4458_c0_g1_i1.p1  ORF type:complete len:117 (+),score=31.13 TRINITY_DN4458_c0_g1_i1:58-408(+)
MAQSSRLFWLTLFLLSALLLSLPYLLDQPFIAFYYHVYEVVAPSALLYSTWFTLALAIAMFMYHRHILDHPPPDNGEDYPMHGLKEGVMSFFLFLAWMLMVTYQLDPANNTSTEKK